MHRSRIVSDPHRTPLGEQAVLAAWGLVGEKSDASRPSLAAALLDSIFEHPAWCSPVVLKMQTFEFPLNCNSFPAAC
jgi:hypothetical protein